MRLVLTAVARILPPAFVLFLFVDLLMNRNIPRLGSSAAPVQQGGLSTEESRDLLAHTRKLLAAGKDQQAMVPALKLYNAWPENYLYIKTLAEINHRLERYKEEAEYWEKFLTYAPLAWEACPDIGLAYWKQDRHADAINAFERCLALDPEDSDSNFFLGHAFEMTGNLKKADAIYRAMVARRPHNMDCRVGLARIDLRQGRQKEAKKLILGTLEDSPNNVDALLVAGIVAWREGDLVQAKQYLTKGASFTKGYADYYLVMGRIEESQGHTAEAILRYNRALEISPDNEEASSRLSALSRRRR
jgi:tetratricopeptide (TPR) repeat protein